MKIFNFENNESCVIISNNDKYDAILILCRYICPDGSCIKTPCPILKYKITEISLR